jgi:hypothetical protein
MPLAFFNPKLKQITVLALRGKKHHAIGEYKAGKAASQLLTGFSADVASVFSQSCLSPPGGAGRR